MHKVFKIIPKRNRAVNGESLSPAMELVVTTNNYTNNPFNSLSIGQVIDAYKRIYGFDYKKCGCMPTDFDWFPVD